MAEQTSTKRESRDFVLLKMLSVAPMRYTAMQKSFVKRTNDSPGIFDDVFYDLVSSGRIVKCEGSKLAPYRITEKGKKMLEALS